MPELNIGSTTTTNLKGTVKDFSVSRMVPDSQGNQKETIWSYPDAAANLGYYKTIPELKSAIRALAIWTAGKGFMTDARTQAILENIIGWGEDSFQSICTNLIIQKKIFGDAFAEIIRDENGRLLNIKPLYTGDMAVVVDGSGLVKRYEQRSRVIGEKPKILSPEKVLHLVNDRIANEIHGISVVECVKFIIDAKNEALSDERKIRHRELAMGVLELDTDDTAKIATAVAQYQNAVKNGEVLVTMKGVSELKDNPNQPRDRLQWLQYLDNLFYQTVGVPKVIATSEGFTEAGGKVGFLTFEPVYTAEQTELESDLWNQAAIKVVFNRPPSLSGMLQESEDKNTGQTGIQPNEVQANIRRTE